MNKNKSVLAFIGGIFTAILVIPILNEVASMFTSWAETVSGKQSVKLAHMQREINDIAGTDDEGSTANAIGFLADMDSSEYDDDEDE